MKNLPTVLIIGTGSIGERHLRCLQSTGRCRPAFCEPLDARRSDVAARYQIPDRFIFATLEEALASDLAIDAAVVASPAPFHIPAGMELAARGIHILMEKPLSLSLDGVPEFLKLIEDKGIVAAVGYTHRAHPAVTGLREKLHSGVFGKALELRVDVGQHLATLRPAYADVYFADPKMGGGAIQDMITHFYSVGEWLLGPMDRIVTHARHLALPRVTVEDTVHSLAEHNGAMAVYAQNLTQPQNEVMITAICENGSIRADYARKRISTLKQPNGDWDHETYELNDMDEIYVRQDSAFLDATEGRGSVFCTMEEAAQTLRVNLASLKSAKTGSWQSVSGNNS